MTSEADGQAEIDARPDRRPDPVVLDAVMPRRTATAAREKTRKDESLENARSLMATGTVQSSGFDHAPVARVAPSLRTRSSLRELILGIDSLLTGV